MIKVSHGYLTQLENIFVFFKMEIEAKQQAMRASKRSVHGSYIQYRSTTMPLHQVRKSFNPFYIV